jgi:hypothetical protein
MSNAVFSPRAQRYKIELPIRYREKGWSGWQDGKTINISGSGVLFRGMRTLDRGALIEFTLTLPVVIAGEGPGQVGCDGVVVRCASLIDSPDAVLAAKIVNPRFMPSGRHKVN